jgi:hypothetical protein
VSAPELPLFLVKGRTLVDVPGTAERTVVERPPPGLGRGARSVPSAFVIALAATLVVITVIYYVLRFRRGRRS